MVKDVTLSDGDPCTVRRLGLFELDEIEPVVTGPFTYPMKTLSGETYHVEYDGSRWDEPPVWPKTAEKDIEEGSDDWWQLRECQLYAAWLSYEVRRSESFADYCRRIARYILDHALVNPEDVKRISSDTDWESVHMAALVPQLTKEVLVDTLRRSFQGGV